MNRTKRSIRERVTEAHMAAVRNGLSPTHLFLGSREIDELLAYTESLTTREFGPGWKQLYKGGKPATRPSINFMGMTVVPMVPPGVFVAEGAWG